MSSWRTLVLGATLGYLVAVLTMNGGGTDGGMHWHPHSHHHHQVTGMTGIIDNMQQHLSKQHPHYPRSLAHGDLIEPEVEETEGHHKGGTEEEEEEENEAMIYDTTITLIVLFLIVLTILFEHMKESVEEAADRPMEPVIEGLFGELTVLGFLSIVTFCVTKLGWFSRLSERVFGEEEEEELLEIFESVHYMLFFVMVFFVVNVLVLMYGGQAMARTWRLYNRACRDDKYMAQLDAILQQQGDRKTTSYWQYFVRELIPCRSSLHQLREELDLFRGLRQEFLLERSHDPPFEPHDVNHRVKDDFDFGRYLAICQAHELGHIVHLSYSTWLFLAGVTLAFYAIALSISNELETYAWIWAGAGWLFFVFGTYFDYHMINLIDWMAAAATQQQQEEGNGEGRALLANNNGGSLPRWTNIDLDDYMERSRSMMARMFASAKTPTRQETMYWMERRGPHIYLILFQIQMVFTAAYVSLLLLTLLPYMCWKSEQTTMERVVYAIGSLLPVYLLLSKYQAAAANLTMACSVGSHRRPQAVAQVIREGKVASMIRAVVTMQKLQLLAADGFASAAAAAGTTNGGGGNISSLELEDAGKIFDALDYTGDGTITCQELGQLLQALGAKATKECLESMINVLDLDKSGSISKDEFLTFYKANMVFQLDDHGLHKLAKDMFQQLDKDQSGEITLAEFKDVLDSFNVGLTMDEIGDLINELDEQDNGTIHEHEFAQLLTKKHRHLFEYVPLPKLE